MRRGDLVLGLLAEPLAGGDGATAARLRDLTLAWSRYGYRDAIVERASIEAILDEAADRGHRYCLVLAPGIAIRERWSDSGGDWLSELAAWIPKHEFLAAGRIRTQDGGWYGLEPRCLLVDLEQYRALGRPRFGAARECPRQLCVPEESRDSAGLRSLHPTGRVAPARPGLFGWGFVEAALRAGMPVFGFDPPLDEQLLDLAPTDADGAARFARYLGRGIDRYAEERSACGLGAQQREFLDGIALHAANARRGVFLWNIESYADVESPPPDFAGPVSRLYSVAAGFKPNRILETHGFDAQTSVVFFDYSEKALEIRRTTRERWDGRDFPRCIVHLLERFPHPDTWYHLWGDLTPERLRPADLERAWAHELARWGGEEAFARHWRAYRELPHEFVHCDVVADPSPLFERVCAAPDEGSVLWFSNAFFTVQSNWYLAWSERRERYEAFVAGLARLDPELLLYGSDHDNANVNWIRAGEYWSRYRELPADPLVPHRLHRHEIRM